MRHLVSLLAGLLIAPAVWLLVAIGQPNTTRVFARWVEQNAYATADLAGPIAYLAGAGLLLGLIACLRLSPAGPTIAGTTYLLLYVAMFTNPLKVLDLLPKRLHLGFTTAEPRVPVTNGTLAILAICLLVAVASGQRWRVWPVQAVVEPVVEPTGEPVVEPEPEPVVGEVKSLGQALAELNLADVNVVDPAPLEQRVPRPPHPDFTAHRDNSPINSDPQPSNLDSGNAQEIPEELDSPWSTPPQLLR